MPKSSLVYVLALCTSFAHAQMPDRFAGTYSALTAQAPVGNGVLKLQHKGRNDYLVDFAIVAPNPTHHTGHINGEAIRDGDIFTLTKENFSADGARDTVPRCVLKFRIDGKSANVMSSDGCAGYGGAAASFSEQGRNLVRSD